MTDAGRDESALEMMVLQLLDSKKVQETEVLEIVTRFGSQFFAELDAAVFERISGRLLERLVVELELGVAITAEEHEPWLPARKQEVAWRRWTAYRTLLLRQGRPLKVLDKLGESTDTILDLAGDPLAAGAWQRRGLVIGEVQSGKTSTYVGLLNKAADAGYRLFIVIGGHTESLRRQTQARIDEGFVGRDSAYMSKELRHLVDQKRVGVGVVNPDIRAYGFTTIMSDFSVKTAQGFNFEVSESIAEPVVLVVKKNTRILANLHNWLKEQAPDGGHRMPVMLLDDEADYASINTNEEEDPTAVNKAIRDLLSLSQRSSYVGFTATPFANVLIDEANSEDLFPRDFIYTLESPSNYVGADAVFGGNPGDTILRDLTDAEHRFPLSHRSALSVGGLPESLVDAIGTFILANAVRDLRGDELEPRSMLVNVSRFNSVQQQVHELVEEHLAAFRNAIEFDPREAGLSTEIDRLRALFDAEFAVIEFEWSEVLEALPAAVDSMQAVLVNSQTSSSESYSKLAAAGRTRIIATGGAVLSRGVTLNGLMTSYFYQKSRASDTLMQMGRWFGYRDGYRDLCRLWIDEEVASWYSFVAESAHELRTDLREMHQLGMTPQDFGLKVRKHPESLLVTAANKSKSAELIEHTISLRDKTLESAKLKDCADVMSANYAASKSLISQALTVADEATSNGNYAILRAVPKAQIAEFLGAFGSNASDPYFAGPTSKNGGSIFAEYVRSTTEADLRTWDVLVVGGGAEGSELIGSTKVGRVNRSMKIADGHVLISGSRRRVAGTSDLGALIPEEIRQELKAAAPRGATISEKTYRSQLGRPALLLYFIEPDEKSAIALKTGSTSDVPILAVKVAFPANPRGLRHETRIGGGVKYLINTVLQKDWLPYLALDLSDDDSAAFDG